MKKYLSMSSAAVMIGALRVKIARAARDGSQCKLGSSSLPLDPESSVSRPKVIKLFSCSTQLSIKFFPLINVKMPTIVGILTFMNGKIAP